MDSVGGDWLTHLYLYHPRCAGLDTKMIKKWVTKNLPNHVVQATAEVRGCAATLQTSPPMYTIYHTPTLITPASIV